MKGFYIEITNNLLDPKHVQAMGKGSAVWEFMWCLDKMTKIDEKGIGWILGGKPIKLEEIAEDLGKDFKNISLNLRKLRMLGYLNLRRTPYGVVISVNKAKKRYDKFVSSPTKRSDEVVRSDLTSSPDPDLTKSSVTKKTIQLDITVDNIYTSKFDFEKFYNIYPKKVGKKKSKELWDRLSQEDQSKALADIPKRKLDAKWVGGYIKDPERYIKYEQWNDDIIPPKSTVYKNKETQTASEKKIEFINSRVIRE